MKCPKKGQKKSDIFEHVPLPYDIDSIEVYNVKANSRPQLLESIKDRQKWKQDSHTDWAGYSSV